MFQEAQNIGIEIPYANSPETWLSQRLFYGINHICEICVRQLHPIALMACIV